MIGVIILAAGQGKRMNSTLPKVLHLLGGKPMITYVLEAAQSLAPGQIIAVTSSELKDNPVFNAITTVVQHNPQGTADAIQVALSCLDSRISQVVILCGDTPLLQAETLQKLTRSVADLTVVGMALQHPKQTYGRIILDDQQCPQAIVEYKDALSNQKALPWANSGVYKISVPLLKELLPQILPHNTAGEYYLTDIVHLAHQKGYTLAMLTAEAEEFQGVNTRQDLSTAEGVLQDRWRQQLMNQGVTLLQPETIILNYDTKIGPDCRIGPFVTFGPGVHLEKQVTILPFCHLENATIESKAHVGPFVHLRGNTVLLHGATIGNFVEVKGSTIGKKAKAKHLSYIGDARVGDNVNIGAGAVTCNYNGFKKFKTTIGTGSMIGANASLIAPLTIGDNTMIAAGSVITEDVPNNALAISRAEQIIKNEGAKRIHKKYSNS